MNPKIILLFILTILVGAGAWLALSQQDSTDTSAAHWDQGNEEQVPEEEWQTEENLGAEGSGEDGGQRQELQAKDLLNGSLDVSEPRPEVTIFGKVQNAQAIGIAEAKVMLDLRRSGRWDRNRITKEVTTAADGSFSFSGQGYQNLRISLQVQHQDYAVGISNKNFNSKEVKGSLDMGAITLMQGGSIRGRLTDMSGMSVQGGEVRLSSQDRGRRWTMGRTSLFETEATDGLGSFVLQHIPAGDYRLNGTAKNRQRQRSDSFSVKEGEVTELDAIKLGPGFLLTGTVFQPNGTPLAGAELSLRNEGRRGRRYNAKSNTEGRFEFDHLPPMTARVEVEADGYLQFDQGGIDVETTQALNINLQEGLRITGQITDAATNQPISLYGAQVVRVANLPNPQADREREEMRSQMDLFRRQMQGEELTAEESSKVEQSMQDMRERFRNLGNADGGGGRNWGGGGTGDGNNRRRGGGRGNWGGGNWGSGMWGGGNSSMPGDIGEQSEHANGEFAFTGLEEGIYVIDVGSANHPKLRSERVELRMGAPAVLNVGLPRGVRVSGVVLSSTAEVPLAGADVELRRVLPEGESDSPFGNFGNWGGGRGNTGGTAGGNAGGTGGNNRWTAMRDRMQSFSNDGPASATALSTKTNAQGKFRFTPVLAGNYLLVVKASGHARKTSDVLELANDLQGMEMLLGALGQVKGVIAGIPADKMSEAQVIAVRPPWTTKEGQVNSDGSYSIKDLQPGKYMVRAYVGSRQDFMRSQMRALMSNRGNETDPLASLQEDVVLAEGQTVTHNLILTLDPSGDVIGKVMMNGEGAQGYRVRLRQVEQGAQDGGMGGGFGGFGGFGGRRGGGRLSASVDQNGDYRITNVPAGFYSLQVQAPRGRSSIYSQEIQVVAEMENVQVAVALLLGNLEGKIQLPAGEEAPAEPEPALEAGPGDRGGRRGRGSGGVIQLFPNTSTVPEDRSQFERDNGPIQRTMVRNDSFSFTNIPVGSYLLQLRGGGRSAVTQQVYVNAGDNSPLQIIAGSLPSKEETPAEKSEEANGTEK